MATVVRYGTKMGESLIHDMNSRYYKGKTLYDCYGRLLPICGHLFVQADDFYRK